AVELIDARRISGLGREAPGLDSCGEILLGVDSGLGGASILGTGLAALSPVLLGRAGVLAGVAGLGAAGSSARGGCQAGTHARTGDGHPQCRLLHVLSSGAEPDRPALVQVGTDTTGCGRGDRAIRVADL